MLDHRELSVPPPTLLEPLDLRPDDPRQDPSPPPRPPAVLDLVIPAYNEEGRIGPTLETLCLQIARAGHVARVIIVDNGSVDATIETVERSRTHDVQIVVRSCRDRGKGAAVRAGVSSATAPFVGFVDADQSTPPDALLTALLLLERGWDGVIGSRRALGGQYAVAQPTLRRLGSRLFNLAAAPVVGRMSDTQCGMKLFRTAAVQGIFADLQAEGFAFDVELLARARAQGLRIMELPVTWSDSPGSSFVPLRDGLRAFRDLARVHRLVRMLPRVTT